MPRLAAIEDNSGSHRVEKALYFRCRRGEQEALATLLYRLGDRLYTAASFVAPDEATAMMAVVGAWEDLLTVLQRTYVGGHLQDQAFRLLGRRLALHASRRIVRRQLRAAIHQDEQGLVMLPEEHLPPLIELIDFHAPLIAASYYERRETRKRALYGAGMGLVVVAAFYGWLVASAGRSTKDLRMACLQQLVLKRELPATIRDTLLELPDPHGADQAQARVLQQASLVLEEIANTGPNRREQALPYLKKRVQEQDLSHELAEIAATREGLERKELFQAQLALEEVANL